MKGQGKVRNFAAAVAAASLFASSAASAAPATMRTVDPLVAVSLLGTASSQAAVCAAGTAAAGAAAAQAANPNCVLPAGETPPTPVADTAPPAAYYPPAPVATAGAGIGGLPLIIGLAALVGGLGWILLDDDDDTIVIPISPV